MNLGQKEYGQNEQDSQDERLMYFFDADALTGEYSFL